MRKSILHIFLMLFVLINSAKAQNVLPHGYEQLEGFPYIICVDSVENENLALTDEQFDQLATGVQFQVNSMEVDRQSEFYKMYSDVLLPLLQREDFVLVKLLIRGAASPEGSYENNRRLGQGRSQNLLTLISNDLFKSDLPPIKVETQTVTEDYRYLVSLMEAAGDSDAAAVKQLFEQCGWDEPCCKQNLQQMRGGSVWKRLLKDYFPRLRSSRIVLFLKHAEVIRTSMTMMTDLKPLDLNKSSTIEDKLEINNIDYIPQPETSVPMEYTRRHLIAVRTNLLRDFFYMPQFGFAPGIDVQLEYYPKGGHLTYNAAFTWTHHRHWNDHKFFQIRDAQLEVRRYFRGGGQFLGPYIGAYAEGMVFGIGLSETKGWEGEGWGAGLALGYVMKLNKKGNFRLEFNLSAGYMRAKHDPYVWGNPVTGKIDGDYYYDYLGSASNFKKRNHLFQWIGPTNAGIQLTYDIIYRKKQKGTQR